MAAPRAFLGLSHSPLYGLNPVDVEIAADLAQALDGVRAAVHAFDPELVVLIGPDSPVPNGERMF